MLSEKDKMLAGITYDSGDPELFAMWSRAQELSHQYNNLVATEFHLKNEVLTQLLGSPGERLNINAPFHCDYGQNIHIGNNCEINFNCTILDCNSVTIGDNALIAPNVQIYAVGHPVRAIDRLPESEIGFCKAITAPVVIGNNVWIGGGAIILPGVTIGNNVTVAAGSVVNRDVPDNVLVAGVPARVIKKL